MLTPPLQPVEGSPLIPPSSAARSAEPAGLNASQELALKYLELARAEILARVEQAHKTLLAYVAAVAAVSSFFAKKLSEQDQHLLLTDHPGPLALILIFLCMAALWGILHNERMIAGLARYQTTLAAHLDPAGTGPHIWENSGSLRQSDHGLSVLATGITQLVVLLAPVLVTLYVTRGSIAHADRLARTLGACGLLVVLGLACDLAWTRLRMVFGRYGAA